MTGKNLPSPLLTDRIIFLGAVLLCAGEKGKRSALPHSRILIHQPLGGAKGQASDILIAAKQIEKTRSELCGIIAECSGQPFEKVLSDADRDYWMTSDEALAYGMIDRVLAASPGSFLLPFFFTFFGKLFSGRYRLS